MQHYPDYSNIPSDELLGALKEQLKLRELNNEKEISEEILFLLEELSDRCLIKPFEDRPWKVTDVEFCHMTFLISQFPYKEDLN